MSVEEGKIAELLALTAAKACMPDRAEAAWARARRVRRRRRVLAGIASAAVVAAIPVLVAGSWPDAGTPDPVPATAGPTVATTRPGVDRVPAALTRAASSALPAGLSVTPHAGTPTLSQQPMERATALVQRHAPDGARGPQPVFALGADGAWRRVEIPNLMLTRDSDGNRADPLRPTALSPDGRSAAIAQPDALVVVDLTTAQVRRVPLPGYPEQVLWPDDATVLVGGDTATFAVEPRAGTATRVTAPVSLWDLATPPDGERWVELPPTAAYDRNTARPVLRRWSLDEAQARSEVPVDGSGLGPYGVLDWQGPATRRGDLVARAGWGWTPTLSGAEQVAVVNLRTGVVERMLALDENRTNVCCRPLGWLDDHTLLVHTDREGILTWNVRSGEISLAAAGFTDATVALARPGPR
jgi:hypothetical protein